LRELEDFVDGLYDELDKLAKKSPSSDLSDFAMGRVNRALTDAKTLIGPHDKYAAEISAFVEAGQNPEVRDAVLALREVRQAIGREERRLGYNVVPDHF
jgi:hypothetical protein